MPEYNWINEEIFTVAEFLMPEECQHYIEMAEDIGFEEAPLTTPYGPVFNPNVRNNTRVILDATELAEQLWTRSVDYIPHKVGAWRAVGVNERLRFYRYEAGQQFDWHLDGAYERPNGERSLLTFMIYLNGGFTGGHTEFDTLHITPETGLALFFKHRIYHRGTPVVEGQKYVLRTDVMYKLE